jgi:hypothetical protein
MHESPSPMHDLGIIPDLRIEHAFGAICDSTYRIRTAGSFNVLLKGQEPIGH